MPLIMSLRAESRLAPFSQRCSRRLPYYNKVEAAFYSLAKRLPSSLINRGRLSQPTGRLSSTQRFNRFSTSSAIEALHDDHIDNLVLSVDKARH
jgi:hypothetical protein